MFAVIIAVHLLCLMVKTACCPSELHQQGELPVCTAEGSAGLYVCAESHWMVLAEHVDSEICLHKGCPPRRVHQTSLSAHMMENGPALILRLAAVSLETQPQYFS